LRGVKIRRRKTFLANHWMDLGDCWNLKSVRTVQDMGSRAKKDSVSCFWQIFDLEHVLVWIEKKNLPPDGSCWVGSGHTATLSHTDRSRLTCNLISDKNGYSIRSQTFFSFSKQIKYLRFPLESTIFCP